MQAVLAANVRVPGRGSADIVYVGDEHGDFYALDSRRALPAGLDRIIWSRNLGSAKTNCFNTPDGVAGITSTPVIDHFTNRIYVAGGDGRAYALSIIPGLRLHGVARSSPNASPTIVPGMTTTGSPVDVSHGCQSVLAPEASRLLRAAMRQFQLSARAFHRTVKPARTIAHLAGSGAIEATHLAEAVQYRQRMRG